MPSFTGKAFANFYKNLLGINQSSNTGIDASVRRLQDGLGQDTSVLISDDQFGVVPTDGDHTAAFYVANKAGSGLFQVDTVNSRVKVGTSLVTANTFYQTFSASRIVPVAGYHMLLSTTPTPYYAAAQDEDDLGNGADPATTYDMSSGNNVINFINCIWRVTDNITIDSASFFIGSNGSSTDTYNVHIMSYDIDTDNGSTSGNLSDGTVVADSSTIASDRTAIDYLSCTIQSADVDAGRVLIATLESDGTDQASINMTMKYHIR